MSLLSISTIDSTALILLDSGTTNAFDNRMVDELAQTFASLEKDDDITAVVVSSGNDKVFSFGFNLPHLIDLDREDFGSFFDNFNRLCIQLYTFPKPLIMAINGHAVAGGCIIALCGDLRFISSGRKRMGVNEIKLGVPVPWPGEIMLRELVGHHHAEKVVLEGQFYLPEELLRIGLVDEIFEPDNLRKRALEKAVELGTNYKPAFAIMKLNARAAITARITKDLDMHNKRILDLWFSDQSMKLLKEAAKKF